MKILLITGSFYPDVGGVQNVVLNIGNELDNEEITVITSTNSRPFKITTSTESYEKFEISRIWMNLPSSLLGYIAFPFKFLISFINLFLTIKKVKPDIINYHFPDDSSFYISIISKIFINIPLITNIHGNDLQVYAKSKKHRKFIKNVLNHSKYIIVNSSYMKSELLKQFPKYDSKIEIIPNGLEVSKYSEIKEAHIEEDKMDYIFYIGRMVKKKGVDVLINAFNICNFKDTKLIIEGNGEALEENKSLVNSLDLKSKIKFTEGELNSDEKFKYMKGSVFCVIPSRIEPFGIVALEYLVSESAIIASKTGGLVDILTDNKDCLFFENGNSEDLADKMKNLRYNTKLREDLIKNGKETIKRYDSKVIANRYLDYYKKVVTTEKNNK